MRRMEGKQDKKKWWHIQNDTSDVTSNGTMQVKAVRRPLLPQHSGPRPLLKDGVLKYRWWLKQKIWIGAHSVAQIEHSRVFLYVFLRTRPSSKMFRHEKKGVVVQQERPRVGASWGDTKAGVARVTGWHRPTQRFPGPSHFIFFGFYFPYQEDNTHSASSSRGVEQATIEVTEKYLTHSSRILDFLLLNSTLSHDPSSPSPPFPLHQQRYINRTSR